MSSTATLGSLPPELLGVIFSFVRPFFRVQVLSLVCKRWHKAVYHSLTKLPLHAPEELIRRLPSLTSVRVHEFQHGLILPNTVRKLYLNATAFSHAAECACRLTSTVSRLTSLTLLLRHFGECPHITATVTLNANSITVLRITADSVSELNLRKILDLRFPSLTELHLRLDFSVPINDFITRHSKHLRRLLLSLPNPFPLTGPFPVLQELRLQGMTVDLQTLPGILRDTQSTLTELELYCWGTQLPDIVKASAPVLVELTVDGLTPDQAACLSACTRLRVLSAENTDPDPDGGLMLPPSLYSQLRLLRPMPHFNPGLHFPRLEFASFHRVTDFVPSLPALRDVSILALTEKNVDLVLQFTSRLLAGSPRLSMMIFVLRGVPLKEMHKIEAFVYSLPAKCPALWLLEIETAAMEGTRHRWLALRRIPWLQVRLTIDCV